MKIERGGGELPLGGFSRLNGLVELAPHGFDGWEMVFSTGQVGVFLRVFLEVKEHFGAALKATVGESTRYDGVRFFESVVYLVVVRGLGVVEEWPEALALDRGRNLNSS